MCVMSSLSGVARERGAGRTDRCCLTSSGGHCFFLERMLGRHLGTDMARLKQGPTADLEVAQKAMKLVIQL